MSKDPSFKFEKRRLTIYETEEWQLVGLTFPSFWRPNQVPVRVGNRVETGFHLLQLWTRYQERAEEVLVLYPADGYWRARPLPPQNLRWSAYGSSFLIGPVEVEGRPFVDIRDIAFDPATRTFTLKFARGGGATLRLDKLDQERIVLDVNLRAAIDSTRPFAALRSMFVTEGNSDVALVGWRRSKDAAWARAPVMSFTRASVAELWAGRLAPSRHNTSAPDMVFKSFSAPRAELVQSCASAPANGWKVKRTVCLPGRHSDHARNSTLALRMSAWLPIELARHHGCQTSLSTRSDARRRVDLDHDLGVAIADDARACRRSTAGG